MNDSGDYKTGRDVAAVYWLYGLLRGLLSAYFSEPRLPEDENVKKAYSLLVAAIKEGISRRGMEPVRAACYIPFKTIYTHPGVSPDEWNGVHRPRVDDAYGRIESLYFAAGALPLDELDEIEDLANGVEKTLKKYRKEKEKIKKKRAGELVEALGGALTETGRATGSEAERTPRVMKDEDARTPLIKKIVIGVIIGVIATVIGRLIVYFLVGG
ncbi:MAG: hypothetical protein JSW52_05615 [Candidatus Coatesbacteria bacterium]|nr:MAG: hypothetical protein JSW52_05615 [Candidatus Coatesbacteria bacterium]